MAIRIDKPIKTGKTKLGKLWAQFKDDWRLEVVQPGGMTINDVHDLYRRLDNPMIKQYKSRIDFEITPKQALITVDFKLFLRTGAAFTLDDESYDDDLRRLAISKAVLVDLGYWREHRQKIHPYLYCWRNEAELFDNARHRIEDAQCRYIKNLRRKGYTYEQIEDYIDYILR